MNIRSTLLNFIGFLTLASSSICYGGPSYDGSAAPIPAGEKAKELEGVGIAERVGTQLDLNWTFKNELGESVRLGQFFDGKTPIIFSPVYYSCPGLCNFHLNGLVEGLKNLDWSVGQNFKVIAMSFDSRENSDLAAAKKASYMKIYDRPGTEAGFSFLTADEETVKAVTSAIGFNYKWNEEQKEWAHASAAVVVSPEGKINRYLPGIIFEAKDIRLAINEATAGKAGGLVDRLVLYCFQYNPHQSKYTLYAFNIMKLAGALMVLILIIWLVPVWIRNRRSQQSVRS